MTTPRERELEAALARARGRIAALEKIIALYRQWRIAPVAKTRSAEESP